MRKILTLTILSILSSYMFAQQLYNGSLATWSNGVPAGWTTSHYSFPNTIHETQDASAMYENIASTKMIGGILPPPANMSYPGFVHYGASAFDNSAQDFVLLGAPFHNRPDSIQFAYKYTPSFQDSATAFCTLYSGNIGNIMGYVNKVLYASSTFKVVTVPIKYYSTQTPDSINLTFYSGDLGMTHSGSDLHIAAVKFIYHAGAVTNPTVYPMDTTHHSTVDTTHAVDTTHTTTAINNIPAESASKVYPNPASTKINFMLNDNMMGGIIKVYNILGSELITSEIGNNNESIDICTLQDGLYVYRILDKNDKLITTGKFLKEK